MISPSCYRHCCFPRLSFLAKYVWRKSAITLLHFISSTVLLNAQDSIHVLTDKEPKKDTLVKIKGSVSVYGTAYYMGGANYRRSPFTWTLSGNPVISFKGVVIPTSIILGKQTHRFHQPFNQLGISPRYKWITLHIGYRNLYYSPFTLNGHTIAGTGIELSPGKWKMAFMYGRLRKAIGEDPLLPYYIQATYRRKGYGGYLSYRNKANLIAFSFSGQGTIRLL